MRHRNISEATVMQIIDNPDSIVAQDGLKVYQKIETQENKSYLFRIFVNDMIIPYRVVTVYKTSKISKYYEGEI